MKIIRQDLHIHLFAPTALKQDKGNKIVGNRSNLKFKKKIMFEVARNRLEKIDKKYKNKDKINKKILDLSVIDQAYKKGVERLKERQRNLFNIEASIEEINEVKELELELKILHNDLIGSLKECVVVPQEWISVESNDDTANEVSDELSNFLKSFTKNK